MPRRCYYAVAFSVAVLLLAAVPNRRAVSGEPQENLQVNAADIGRKVEIIGRLGKPIGTLLSLRGHWRMASRPAKPRSPDFHVTHLNGMSLSNEVVFYGETVTALNLKKQVDHEADGTVWEMRAFEEGRLVNLRARHWEEFYGAPVSPPDYGQGPFVCFLVGNVKKEIAPGENPQKPKRD